MTTAVTKGVTITGVTQSKSDECGTGKYVAVFRKSIRFFFNDT